MERARPFIEKAGFLRRSWEEEKTLITAAAALEHEKVKLLADVPRLIDFFFKDVEFDAASVDKTLKKEGVADVLAAKTR